MMQNDEGKTYETVVCVREHKKKIVIPHNAMQNQVGLILLHYLLLEKPIQVICHFKSY